MQVIKLADAKPSATHFMMVQVGVSNLDAKSNHKIVLYSFLANRRKEILSEAVNGYKGFIMTDGLKGYLDLNDHLNYWVHAVRQLKAILKINKKATDALILVSFVNELYSLETKLRKQYQ